LLLAYEGNYATFLACFKFFQVHGISILRRREIVNTFQYYYYSFQSSHWKLCSRKPWCGPRGKTMEITKVIKTWPHFSTCFGLHVFLLCLGWFRSFELSNTQHDTSMNPSTRVSRSCSYNRWFLFNKFCCFCHCIKIGKLLDKCGFLVQILLLFLIFEKKIRYKFKNWGKKKLSHNPLSFIVLPHTKSLSKLHTDNKVIGKVSQLWGENGQFQHNRASYA
jgi:hypothetical protein